MAQNFSELEAALERINAGQLTALCISFIDSQAERAEVREGGIVLLAGNGLVEQHQAGDRNAVGAACPLLYAFSYKYRRQERRSQCPHPLR
jgi:hypothetical protein